MKFDQLIEYNKRNIFFKIHAENEVGRLVQTSLFLKKLEVKVSGLELSFNVFR